jgi:heme-degrading monooxygenase HmoA
MKHQLRWLVISMLPLAITVSATAQAPSPQNEVVIVMALSVDPTASPEKIRDRAREVTAQLRKQPGALDDAVLKNAAKAEYLLVMRWRQRQDWEAMLGNTGLWKSLEQPERIFKLQRSAIFEEVR